MKINKLNIFVIVVISSLIFLLTMLFFKYKSLYADCLLSSIYPVNTNYFNNL